MRLLSRYVRRYFLTYLVSGLAACAGLLLLVDLFDRIDTFIGRQVLWIDAIHYLDHEAALDGVSNDAGSVLAGLGRDLQHAQQTP